MNINYFISSNEYIDENNYPNGFHYSTDFTEFEADVLSLCGNVVIPLANGEQAPQNKEQKDLLAVFEGRREPCYFVEKVFIKYFNLTGFNHLGLER